MCAVLPQPKCVKLRALHSSCKFGVAARSCQELLRKGCIRFQLPVPGSRLCMYEDGTEVTDDCFPSLPNDSELLLLTAGETWHGYVSDITRLLSVFNEPHAGVIQAARQLLSDEQAPLRQKLLADLLHHVSQNITAETREQDPSWFEGMRAGMTMAARESGAGRRGPLWSREAQGDLCLFQIPMLPNRGWTGLWNE